MPGSTDMAARTATMIPAFAGTDPDELTDDDLRRVRIDPQRDPVRALVITPLFGVMPERIRVLSGYQVVAKHTFEPRSIARFSCIVLPPGFAGK